MMALYMPMQPSSKTPMIALPRRNSPASRLPSSSALAGSWNWLSARAWLTSCCTVSPASHLRKPLRKNSSVKSSLHNVLYVMPALVIDAFRFSMPTSPGHWPLQLATVRIGPLCVYRPCRI